LRAISGRQITGIADFDGLVFLCVIFVEDDNAFKQEALGVVFVGSVFIFFPVIIVLAHKAAVVLV
jgi:hypothetical protein